MSDNEFKTELKKWLNHKFILFEKSPNYLSKTIAIKLAKDKFYSFLIYSKNYSIGQLALDVKRNHHLLQDLVPIPNNPSYQNAQVMLHGFLNKAQEILNTYNLNDIV